MAWCPYCGRFWIVRTGQYVTRSVMSRSHDGIMEPPDIACPSCAPPPDETS